MGESVLMANALDIVSQSPEETERLGTCLAAMLRVGAVVALRGELASGKTCFVRGMAEHAAAGASVHSPTFTLVNQYGDEPRLYHLDLYRLESIDALIDLGYDECFDSDGICVIEWAERADPLLPAKRLDIYLEHMAETTRRLRFVDAGVLPPGWQEALREGRS